MTAFLCFVAVAVLYAAAMIWLGRYLRRRGHGSKLDALAVRYERAKDGGRKAARPHLFRLSRRDRRTKEDEPSN